MEPLDHEIEAVFAADEEYFLLVDDCVCGVEGPRGLRLIGNCLFNSTYGDATGIDTNLASTTPTNDSLARLAVVEERIEQIKNKPGVTFVLCYHLPGTAAWKLAWSANLSHVEAVEEMWQFVRCGLLFDVAMEIAD